ncbi:hypothetical protein FLA_6040 [Filimonas lacunae]|nr:hypothetical protein FLA_6040 [Filimonas lacunae]
MAFVAFTYWKEDIQAGKTVPITAHNHSQKSVTVNTPYVSTHVTSLLTNPCLVTLLDSITNPCLSTYISHLFAYTYNGSQATFSLSIAESDTKKCPGWTDVSRSNPSELTIYLNKSIAPDASREYWTTVLGHEIIHSFIIINHMAPHVTPGVPPYLEVTHELMVKSWVTSLAEFIRTCHPALSKYDSFGLALDGLQDIMIGHGYESDTNWDNFIQSHYNISITEAGHVGDAYAFGGYGTECP